MTPEQNNVIDFPAAPDGVRRIIIDVPDGPEGIRQTLLYMRRAVRENMRNPELIATANAITAGARGFRHQAELIHNFVRDRIRYLMHPDEIQLVRGPLQTLQLGAADCVGKSVLEAALLKAAGHDGVMFVAMATEPDAYTHVYIRTRIGSEWVGADPTVYESFGWEPTEGVVARMKQGV